MGNKVTKLNIWAATHPLKRLITGKKFKAESYWILVDYSELIYHEYDKLVETRKMLMGKYLPMEGNSNNDVDDQAESVKALNKEWEAFLDGKIEISKDKPIINRSEVDLTISSPDDIVILTINNIAEFNDESKEDKKEED